MISDGELLGQYAHDGSEAAFAELVRRHVDWVYSTALRKVGGDRHLAEDVAQRVFTVMARQAYRLVDHPTVMGWLHTCAHFTATNLVRAEQRRRAREQEALVMHENSTTPEIAWEQLRPELDDAINRLKPRDRDALLLRFFQNKSHREIGRMLGLDESTARKRGERALEKLRVYFAARGVNASAALLASALTANSVLAAPDALAANVTAAALAAGGNAGLVNTLLKALYMTTKTKIILASAVVVLAAALPFAVSYVNRAGSPSGPMAPAGSSSLAMAATTTASAPVAATTTPPVAPVAPAVAVVTAPAATPVVVTGRASVVVNPRAAMPGVYPNRPKFSVQTFTPETMMRIQYGNLFQKMQFTPEQVEAFVKILTDQQTQQGAIIMQNPIDPQTASSMRSMTLAETQAILDQHDAQLEPLMEALAQNTTAQLAPLLGSPDNVDYYQTYTDQNKERTIIASGYANMLDSADVPPLTVDQEEQVVNLVYQARYALNGNAVGGSPIPPDQAAQILQQAGTFLSPDQVTVLQKVMPSLVAPLHHSSTGGG